jgi:16S rRNA (guanine1207-N2)-methyltransferase
MTEPPTILQVPQGRFELHRLPRRRRELLRAWDAADEYLLRQLAEQAQPAGDARLLVVNDGFGALAVALAAWSPQAWSDSWLSQAATRENLVVNAIDPARVSLVDSLRQPTGPLDLVLIKVPKTLALLEDQLIRLRPLLRRDTRVMVAAMLRGLPRTVWPLLERIVGPTDTAPGWKKAKLISVTPDPALPLPQSPYPVSYRLEGTDHLISNHANVFSRDGLDIGTRFFLQHLPVRPAVHDIVDLGCGNGVVGLLAAERHPHATLHFVDESFMAVASARDNFRRAFGDGRVAEFRIGDGLRDFAAASVDLVLCNPPFHQQQAVDDQIAKSMFRQSRRALRAGGELWVIGNRHLGYHVALKRLFGNCELVASNAKFVILRALR